MWKGKTGRDKDRLHIKGRNAEVKKKVGQRYAEPEVGRVTQVWLLVHMTGYGYSYTGQNGEWDSFRFRPACKTFFKAPGKFS